MFRLDLAAGKNLISGLLRREKRGIASRQLVYNHLPPEIRFFCARLSVIAIRWQMVDVIRSCDVEPRSSNLQGEQCNTVPDTIDDIVADIAQEEKEEGEYGYAILSNLWHLI